MRCTVHFLHRDQMLGPRCPRDERPSVTSRPMQVQTSYRRSRNHACAAMHIAPQRVGALHDKHDHVYFADTSRTIFMLRRQKFLICDVLSAMFVTTVPGNEYRSDSRQHLFLNCSPVLKFSYIYICVLWCCLFMVVEFLPHLALFLVSRH